MNKNVHSVMWATSASHAYIALLTDLAASDPKEARRIAGVLEETVTHLSSSPTGHSGRMMGTYECEVPDTPYTVQYSILPNRHVAILGITTN